MSEGRELGWDEWVEEGDGDFTLLEPGKVKFTVLDFERTKSKNSGMNMAKIKLSLETKEGLTSTCFTNLVLSTKTQWKIFDFFRSLGCTTSDGKVKMDWNGAIGMSGFCEIKVKEYNGKESNEVDKFLEPKQKQEVKQEVKQELPKPSYQKPTEEEDWG